MHEQKLLLFTIEGGRGRVYTTMASDYAGCFFDFQSNGTNVFALYESLRTIQQKKMMFNVLLKQVIYILDGLGVIQLTQIYIF